MRTKSDFKINNIAHRLRISKTERFFFHRNTNEVKGIKHQRRDKRKLAHRTI
jgi:hypothetical protein